MKRSRLRIKRRTTPYGGASAEFPKVGDFQAFIRERDGYRCQACASVWCGPADVAHLLFKVGMGGRKNVSVNQPWNAILLGRECHEEQEHDRLLTSYLVRRLIERFGYVLPEEAENRLERYSIGDDFPNGFDPVLSPTDGRNPA